MYIVVLVSQPKSYQVNIIKAGTFHMHDQWASSW